MSQLFVTHKYAAARAIREKNFDKAEVIINGLWRQHFQDRIPAWTKQITDVCTEINALVDERRLEVRSFKAVAKEVLRDILKGQAALAKA